VALIGLGLVGKERLSALVSLREKGRPLEIVALLDPFAPDGVAMANRTGAPLASSVEELLSREPGWVVVATPHDEASRLLPPLLNSGAGVLVEKPLGRSSAEAERLARLVKRPGQLWVGFNYRFFDGVSGLIRDARSGWFGRLVSLTMVMGHGGSPGDQHTWKLDPGRAGGGALIDPGVHLLDLCRLLSGDSLDVVGGRAWGGFWETGVEEECHLILTGTDLPIVNLAVSIVRWRSTFRMELFGVDGYGVVEGRNRSYGDQVYRRGRRWGWQQALTQAASEEHVVTASGEDVFEREIDAVVFGNPGAAVGPCAAEEAVEIMRLLDRCRESLGVPVPDATAAARRGGER
jgi:predicted dehydrogenase